MREKTVKFGKPNVGSHNCKASIPRLLSDFQSDFKKKNVTFEDRCCISFLDHPRTNHMCMAHNLFLFLCYVSHIVFRNTKQTFNSGRRAADN